jgi:GT2 family glycosyltransferase
MQPNPHLSIVIPTFNRADFLDYCLEVHIPIAKAHNIQLFISDNASSDATAEVVKKRTSEYPLIQYHRNETNLGSDINFEFAMKYPQTDYVWLLGDTYQIPAEGINYLLDLITVKRMKYDAFVFNVANRVSDVAQQDYTDQNKLLSDLGWHMTCMASLVYSSKLIANADFKRYRNTNFIQTGVIFEQIANREFFIHWVESISVLPIHIEGHIKKSWQDQTFEIWARRWPNFIFSLPPSYELEIKLKCVKDHGIKSGIFSLKNLRDLRTSNIINNISYKQYSHLFPLTVCYSRICILSIMLFPKVAYKIFGVTKLFAKIKKHLTV